jgi:hypothetical protein
MSTVTLHGRWAWKQVSEEDQRGFQIPDGFPEYIIYDVGEDDPVLAYCDSSYEAESVAKALDASDRVQDALDAVRLASEKVKESSKAVDDARVVIEKQSRRIIELESQNRFLETERYRGTL